MYNTIFQTYSLGNCPFTYDDKIQVFPTAPSPTSTHLTRQPVLNFAAFNLGGIVWYTTVLI